MNHDMYQVDTLTDISYSGGPQPQCLDVYRPRGVREPIPAVVYFHGGGWTRGGRKDYAETRLIPLASHGILVASASYRLAPEWIWPAQLEDARTAIQFVRSRAGEWMIDPNRISVWGASAGGHLAAMTALTGSLVHSAVIWFAPTDLMTSMTAPVHPKATMPSFLPRGTPRPAFEARLLGAQRLDDVAEEAKDASPIAHVTHGAPPFLIMHGDRDAMIPDSQSRGLHEKLLRAGGDSTLLLVGGATHEDRAFDSFPVLGSVASMLMH